jgi:hypothetical protein
MAPYRRSLGCDEWSGLAPITHQKLQCINELNRRLTPTDIACSIER